MYFYLKLFDYIENCLGQQGYSGLLGDFLINRFSVYYHVLMGLYNISNIAGGKNTLSRKNDTHKEHKDRWICASIVLGQEDQRYTYWIVAAYEI